MTEKDLKDEETNKSPWYAHSTQRTYAVHCVVSVINNVRCAVLWYCVECGLCVFVCTLCYTLRNGSESLTWCARPYAQEKQHSRRHLWLVRTELTQANTPLDEMLATVNLEGNTAHTTE